MRVRVLHLITDLSLGGANMMLLKLLAFTDREEFEPFVIVLADKGALGSQIEALGIPVYPLEMQAGKVSLGKLLLLKKLTRDLRPDLIQAWMYHGNVIATLVNWLGTRVPVVWNIRHTPYDLKNYKKTTYWIICLGAWLSAQPRYIVYNSQISARRHHDLGYSDKNSIIIPNGFDLQKFRPNHESRVNLRTSLNLPEDSFLIGLITRFHPMKDHENFLQAAAKLVKRDPNVYFILAGRNVDGDNTFLVNLIQVLDLENQVHLLGELTDTSNVIPALDILSLSSAWGEAFPNIIGEAMACEVPCVATAIGDCARIIGDTGLIVPPKDADALCRAWVKILEMSEQERLNLGTAARQRVQEQFSLQSIVSQYEKLYSSALNTGDAA
jgi:glycosyltransferase involved in cell wall biosynthesis